jgi:hypothetical protein
MKNVNKYVSIHYIEDVVTKKYMDKTLGRIMQSTFIREATKEKMTKEKLDKKTNK